MVAMRVVRVRGCGGLVVRHLVVIAGHDGIMFGETVLGVVVVMMMTGCRGFAGEQRDHNKAPRRFRRLVSVVETSLFWYSRVFGALKVR